MKRILWLLVFAALWLNKHELSATHVLGGEFTYRYLGANGPANAPFQFELRLVGYVDKGPNSNFPCGNFGNNPRIRIFDGSTTAEILRLNIPNQSNPCTIPTYVIPKPPTCSVPGLDDISIAVNDYTFRVNLPLPANLGSPEAGYYLTFQSCCRSDITTNLLSPGGVGNVYWAFIPSPVLPNSSPQFADAAVPFICLNDTVSIINNASDPDGDKLIYSFVTPFGGGLDLNQLPPPGNSFYTTPENALFAQGFTATDPFGNSGFASINPTSGLTKYFVTDPGSYVVTIQIQEFRTLPSGVEILLSTTRREFLILAQFCEENPTPIGNGGAPGVNIQESYTIFEGDSLSFTIGAADPDSVFIEPSGDILDGTNGYTGPLATFPRAEGATTASSNFKWKTACGIRGVFSVNLNISDRGCPPKSAKFTIQINVLPFQAPRPILGLDSVCSNNSQAIYNVVSNAPPSSLRWRAIGGTISGTGIGTNVGVNWAQNPGTIRLIATSGQGCKDSVSRSIAFVNVPLVSISSGDSAFVCQGTSISLIGQGGFNNYTWTGDNLSAQTGTAVTATPTQSGVYTVVSRGPANCFTRDTTQLNFVPNVAEAGLDTALCSNVPVQLGSTAVDLYNYNWLPINGGLSDDSISNPIATLVNPGSNPIIRTFIQRATHGPSGCVSADTINLTINPLPVVNAGADTATFCSGARALLGTQGVAQLNYLWSPPNGLLSPNTDTTSVSLTNPSFTTPIISVYRLQAVNPITSCSNIDSIAVKVNPLPEVLMGVNDSICSGQAITLGADAQPNRSYSWSPGTGLSATNIANPVYSRLNNGQTVLVNTYRLTVTNTVTNCVNQDSINLRVNPLPIANAGIDRSICSGDSTSLGSVPADIGQNSYVWAPSEGISRATVPNPRLSRINPNTGGADTSFVYILQATVNRTGCQKSDTMVLTVKPLPIAEAGSDTVVTCSNIPVGVGSNALSNHVYNWTPGNLVVNDTLASTQAVIANPGQTQTLNQLVVTVRNRLSTCVNTDTIYVKTNFLPIVNLNDRDSLCSGASLALGAEPVGGYNYNWSPIAGLSSSSQANPTISLTANPGQPYDTVYTLTVTIGATGCVNNKPINIRVNPLPVPNAGPDVEVCSGDTIRIGTPIGSGFAPLWTPAAGLSGATVAQPIVQIVNPNTGGSNQTQQFVLQLTNSQTGCENKDSATVTIKPLPTAIAAITDTVVTCSEQSVELGSAPLEDHNYSWNPTDGLTSGTAGNPTLTLVNATQQATFNRYIVTVNNTASGCTNRDSVTVRVNPLPIANAGVDRSICSGDSTSLGSVPADIGQNSYVWAPSEGISRATVPNPRLSRINPNTGGSDTSFVYVLQATVNRTGCQKSDTMVLTVKPLPIAEAGSDTVVTCSNIPVGVGSNALSNHVYNWTPGNLVVNDTLASTQAVIANPGQTQTLNQLVVTVRNRLSTCVNTDTIYVKTNFLPIVNLNDRDSLCSGASLALGAEPVGGYNYNWSPIAGLSSSTQANPTISLTANPGQPYDTVYTLTVTIGATGCVNNKPINIRVNPLPVPNAGPDVEVCSGDTIRIGTPIGSGFAPLWTPAEGLSGATVAQPIVQIVNPNTGGSNQTQQFVLQLTNSQTGCENKDSATVTIKPLPTAIAASTDTVVICSEQSVALGSTALTDHNYSWSPIIGLTSGTASNPTLTLVNATQQATFNRYIVTVNNTASACTNRDSVTVRVNPLPIVLVGTNRSFCSGLTLQLGADPVAGFAYQWNPRSPSFSNSQVANPVYTNLNPSQNVADSTYFLTVRNEVTGCENSDSIVISILPLPIADAGANDTTCSGNTVVIGSTGLPNRSYTWSSSTTTFSSGLSNPGFTFSTNTTTTNSLTVLVTNTLTGCQSRDSVLVTHHPRPDRVSLIPFVPTICPFSPGIRYNIANPPAGSTFQWSVLGGTVVSGQGSNSLTVNWGATNPSARVRFVPVNEFGCDGPADSVAIVINQLLRPLKPVGDSVLCSAQALQRVYTSPTSSNSTYTWRTENGNPPSFTTTGNSFTVDWTVNNGLGRIWVEEVASTLDSSTVPPTPVQCFGQSDTLLVRINPTPLNNLAIGGESSVCAITSDSVAYTLPGFVNSTYAWSISPSTGWVQRGANGSSTFSVGWVNVETFTVSVFETSDRGCVGNTYTREVRVNPLPRPVIAGNDLNICPQNLSGRSYTVGSSPGYPGTSTFNWTVTGGTFDGASTGNPVRINWSESGTRTLSVREISQFGCIKDTTLSLVNDNTSLVMNLVTTLPEDDKTVQINFAANNAETLAQTLTLERTELGQNDWTSIQTGIAKTATVLTDNSINTSEKAYQYRVSTTNLCNVALYTLPHNTILLNGFGRENPTALGPENVKLTTLDWNPYQNWSPQLAGYSLLRKLDNQSAFSPYESGIASQAIRFEKDNGGDGFNQCYRLVAQQEGTNRMAYSNVICVDFNNVLKFTNVITPNGDNKNDGWYIDNLRLYPENELLIFDRWGKKVFEVKNYSEDNLWKGGENKAGTYFYTFKENRRGQIFKGTITILD